LISYQRTPVSVKISNSKFRNKLRSGDHKEVHVKEELKLVVQSLKINKEKENLKYTAN